MYRFYVDDNYIYEESLVIRGSDVNHIRKVLRMTPGEKIIVNDKSGTDYYCIIDKVDEDEVIAVITEKRLSETELPVKIYLFQALPKLDKMELIIQKAVELGVYEVIPVETRRCVVKLEKGTKQQKKIARWQTIAEAAAKQSARGIIPQVKMPMGFSEALKYAAQLEYNMIPYENAQGMKTAGKIMETAMSSQSVGIFIGPEGGYEEKEIEAAIAAGVNVVSLGKRILRTETAGMTVLSILMFGIESNR